MKIKVWDYLKEYEASREEILKLVDEVFSSGWLILGESVSEFENTFSSYCNSSYGIGVNSGTDALFLALKALDIGPGDEVITVANTAVPTVSAIVSTGAIPRFVDVKSNTYLMDIEQLDQVLTPKTKCVLPVHLYGQCVNMNRVTEFAQKNKLSVLEDCAQSAGAMFEGKKSGAFGEVAAFSFYPTKILGGYGDGGMVVTQKEELSEKVRKLRMYGMVGKYYSEEHGYNSRLDEVHAKILTLKLKYLDSYVEKRRLLADNYRRLLGGSELILPEEAEGNSHAYYLYVVRHPRRDAIIEELKKHDIFLNISYPWPIHTMQGYVHLGYKKGDLPVTEDLAKEIFSLPMYPTLIEADQERTCQAILKILGN
jgi:dTDP-3-amino-2,3,6-trideoxy-4-keto-D-glucose/dTDP-3-amino-3,4,6-trideoxy-alpha-D-glucose/dTDP-2,6-dideoxy-D-kanosamine transaminase